MASKRKRRKRNTAAPVTTTRDTSATTDDEQDKSVDEKPDEKDVADLLRRLQGMATQSNLTIREFSPQPVAARQMYVEWPIGLQLDGTYHNLGAFLERVSKFPRIINVTSIHIKNRDERTAGSATISADCTATTFVLVEPDKAAIPAAGK